MNQLSLEGHDWRTEGAKRRQSQAEARRQREAVRCAARLKAAAESLHQFLTACRECADGSGDEQRGAADGRLRLIEDLSEYAGYLEWRYGNDR